MEQSNVYNEDAWIKTVFLISDLHTWLQGGEKELFYQLPISEKRKLFRSGFYLTCHALAHILERHHYKISRHPNCGKFMIPVAELVSYIRQASHQPTAPVPNSLYLQRVMQTETFIGVDKYNQSSNTITVISDNCGKVITAFPGTL